MWKLRLTEVECFSKYHTALGLQSRLPSNLLGQGTSLSLALRTPFLPTVYRHSSRYIEGTPHSSWSPVTFPNGEHFEMFATVGVLTTNLGSEKLRQDPPHPEKKSNN